MVWKYERFIGDDAVYAFCPICGFHHNPSETVKDGQKYYTYVRYQYAYCPACGMYLHDDDNNTVSENMVSISWINIYPNGVSNEEN